MLKDFVAAQAETFTDPVLQVEAVAETDAEQRLAAVCEGAVRYLPNLRAFANSLARDPHLADDLVQATILRALEASHQFTPGSNFKAWSFTILRNVFYNRLRRPEWRHVALDACTGYMPTTEPSQDKTLEFCDLRRAFAQLGRDQKQALLMVGVSELEYDAAAKISGVAKGTIKSRVSRARVSLKSLMEGGPLALSRQDVAPVSSLDLGSALQV